MIGLSQSERLLQTMADTSCDGLLAFDAGLQVVLWNKVMESLTGLPAQHVLGKHLFRDLALPGEFLAAEHSAAACQGQHAVVLNRWWPSPHAAAKTHSYTVYYHPWRGEGAELCGGLVSVRRNVTSHEATSPAQQGEAPPPVLGLALTDPHLLERGDDARFKIMADCAPVMLWLAALDGRCIFFNQPWLAFSGKTQAQEFGFGWAEGIHHEDFQECIDTYMAAFCARREFTMEYRLRRFDGEFRWILDTGRPYWSTSGEFLGFIGSCIDISELRKAKQLAIDKARLETRISERERAARELRAANEELEAFTYTVSHDLRAPLRGIRGFAQALDEDYGAELTEDAKHFLAQIRMSSIEMSQLIDDLLAFARFSRQVVNRQLVDHEALVQTVVAEVQASRPAQVVRWQLGTLPPSYGDPSLLRQVYTNLLDNAAKYSQGQSQAEIEVGYTGDGQAGAYFVKDNGAGFNMAYADKLFGVFQRLHRADEFEGTGLGLAIVQRIIQRHGGRVWADAAPGQGATFFFTLPHEDAGEAASFGKLTAGGECHAVP